MSLWWIGNIIFLGVIIPVVVLILFQVLAPLFQIRKYAEDITHNAVQFGPHLDALQELATTSELVKEAGAGLGRYAKAIDNR